MFSELTFWHQKLWLINLKQTFQKSLYFLFISLLHCWPHCCILCVVFCFICVLFFSFTLMSFCTYKEKPWILHYKEVKSWCLAGKHCALGNDLAPKLSTSTYKQWSVHKLLSPWVLIVTCQRRDLLSLAGRPRLPLLPSAVTFNKNIIFWYWQFWIQWLPSLKDSEKHKMRKPCWNYFQCILSVSDRMERQAEQQMGT